jgi:hypothetical protein
MLKNGLSQKGQQRILDLINTCPVIASFNG